MFAFKSVKSFQFPFLSLWIFACTVMVQCIQEDPPPTFPRPKPNSLTLKNQYIIQFEDTPKGNAAKHNLLAISEEGKIVMEIPSRNIVVATFSSQQAAEKCRTQGGINFLEKGKRIAM